MAIGWFVTLAEAESYFSDERLETDAWDALSDGTGTGTKDEKTAVLKQAYNRIYYCREFIVPTYAEASSENLVILKKAQAEMAYYMALHLTSEDRRKGLTAQGVSQAGVVKETYDPAVAKETPIPSVVRDLLCTFLSGVDTPFYTTDIDRNEDYPSDEDVTDLL